MSGLKMTCEWERAVSDLHDGELEPGDAEAVRTHLADCPNCQEWLGFLLQLDARASAYAERLKAKRRCRDIILALALGALAAVLVWWAS